MFGHNYTENEQKKNLYLILALVLKSIIVQKHENKWMKQSKRYDNTVIDIILPREKHYIPGEILNYLSFMLLVVTQHKECEKG